ncbi:unnamed protein product [Musa hybrid cultivar]
MLHCCGSKRFAREMAFACRFADVHHALRVARDIWFNKVAACLLRSSSSHPAVADSIVDCTRWSKEEQSAAMATATDSILQVILRCWNARYREKFGFVFPICTSGRGT